MSTRSRPRPRSLSLRAGALVLMASLGCARSPCSPSTPAAPPGVDGGVAEAEPPRPLLPFRPLVADARLHAVRQHVRARAWRDASIALAAAQPPSLDAAEKCRWRYFAGRLASYSEDWHAARAAFDEAAEPHCPLASHAAFRAAEAHARAGFADVAVLRARAALSDPNLLARRDAETVLAEALATRGDRVGAAALWKASLERDPRGPRWVDTSVRLARALVDGVSVDGLSASVDAPRLVRRVLIEAPTLGGRAGADALAEQLARTSSARFTLDAEERVRRAQAALDGGDPQSAADDAGALLHDTKLVSGVACKAATVRAKASMRLKTVRSEDAWSEATRRCDGDPDRVAVLWAAAKALGGKSPDRALDWLRTLEASAPDHRLADDARLRAATIQADRGDRAAARSLLASVPDAYPSGDMGAEALFHLALLQLEDGELDRAAATLDRADGLPSGNDSYSSAGRASYFRARVDELAGAPTAAADRYAAVIERYPLAYYMLLARSRLAALDAPRAKALDASLEAKAAVTPPPAVPPALATPLAQRAFALLEVFEVDLARQALRDASALGPDAPDDARPLVGWAFDDGEAPEIGSFVARGRGATCAPVAPAGGAALVWQAAYPRAFEEIVVAESTANGLAPAVAWGVMREESGFFADVKSHADAYGLMQLIEPTARLVAKGTAHAADPVALRRPTVSVALGTKLLSSLVSRHKHMALALAAYNAGSGAVDRWMRERRSDALDLFVEEIPYSETRNYVKRVLSSQATYARLYDAPNLARWTEIPLQVTP